MEINELISEQLWERVRKNYLNENYKGAIQEGTYYLSEIIREKSGLDGDGNDLMGTAFGGVNPPIKINNMKTKSEKSEQEGFMFIFKGYYSAIRNPRSHKNWVDIKEDADAILIFLDFLLKKIDKSKSKFSKENFYMLVSDSNFVPKWEYAEEILQKITKEQHFDIAIELYRNKENYNTRNLYFILMSIYDKIDSNQKDDIIQLIQEDLLKVQDNHDFIKILSIIRDELWLKFDKAVKIRSEYRLIEAVKGNYYDANNKRTINYTLSSYIEGIHKYFYDKESLIKALEHKFVFSYGDDLDFFMLRLFSILIDLVPAPSKSVADKINRMLKFGNSSIHSSIGKYFDWNDTENLWVTALKDAFNSFTPKEDDDELPF